MSAYLESLFGLQGEVAVVTGATGLLGGAMARGLALAGARVAILGRREDRALEAVAAIEGAGGEAMAVLADVLDRPSLESARDQILARWGTITILVNAAGGQIPGALARDGKEFFSLDRGAIEEAIDLNLMGTILPTQVFGAAFSGRGCIVNISSVTAPRPLTRGVAYAAAKAAVTNFTQWLAIELPRALGPGLRANAIMPGFMIADQNRAMLMQPDGQPTERGRTVLAHTPAGRFGEAEELVAALIWLCSPAASFVNGAVIAVDGGFDAFSGV